MSTSCCAASRARSPTFSSSLSPAPASSARARVYLDHAGSAPVLTEVRAALRTIPEGNPSSPHSEGRAARAALDAARDRAASALEVDPRRIIFCASGTEAVNLALVGAGRRLAPGKRVVSWEAEHQSTLAALRRLQLEGRPLTLLPVDGEGRATTAIPDDAALVSVGLANNEVGTLQPVEQVARAARAAGALIHLDACQGPAWVRPPVELADLVSISGHKIGAGRGGLLVADPEVPLDPLILGGPQEWSRRAGREDVAAAVAVAAALAACAADRYAWAGRVRPLAGRLRERLAGLGGRLTGGEPRLPNYATAAFARVRGEDLLVALDLAGIAASSGSACASGSLDPSHVLLAMGFSLPEAMGSLRLTLGPDTAASDVDRAVEALEAIASLV